MLQIYSILCSQSFLVRSKVELGQKLNLTMFNSYTYSFFIGTYVNNNLQEICIQLTLDKTPHNYTLIYTVFLHKIQTHL